MHRDGQPIFYVGCILQLQCELLSSQESAGDRVVLWRILPALVQVAKGSFQNVCACASICVKGPIMLLVLTSLYVQSKHRLQDGALGTVVHAHVHADD